MSLACIVPLHNVLKFLVCCTLAELFQIVACRYVLKQLSFFRVVGLVVDSLYGRRLNKVVSHLVNSYLLVLFSFAAHHRNHFKP
jgi:hypothetical protein